MSYKKNREALLMVFKDSYVIFSTILTNFALQLSKSINTVHNIANTNELVGIQMFNGV